MRPRKRSWSINLRPWLGLFCGLLVCSPPARVSAANAGATSGSILKNYASARAMGMGGAFTAVSDDVAAIHWNPAGVAGLKSPRAVQFMRALQVAIVPLLLILVVSAAVSIGEVLH